MKHSVRRVLLATMLGATVVTASACDPAGAEAWGRIVTDLVGGVLAVGIAIIIVIAGLPPV